MIEQTLVVIKPDGVERGLIGKIISRFEDAGLKIVGMKQLWIDTSFSKKHYVDHVEKEFYAYLEDFIVSGPVVALVLEGIHAVEFIRKMVGPTEPKTAPSGTIRGDFASASYTYSDANKMAIKNLIHASEDVASAKKEIALWFTAEELHSYARTDERHTR